MTNERARRIVDAPADAGSDSIAPPPIDRADEESQLEELSDAPETSEATEAAAVLETDESAATTELIEEPEGLVSDDEAVEDELDDEVAAEDEVVELEEADLEDDEAPVAEPVAEPAEEQAPAAELAEEAEAEDDAGGDADAAVPEHLGQLLEAMLFVADEPVAPSAMARALELTPRQVRHGLDDLADALRESGRGIRLQQGPEGAQLVTAPEAASTVEVYLGLEANRRLSSAALETLAIIAYRQPVTRHVIDQIRGVNSDGALATLRARGLIEGVGRAPGPGRPLLFSTTQRFLEHFGLERPDELPPLPEDVELPPEAHGAQLPLGATAEGATAEGATSEGATSEGGDAEATEREVANQLELEEAAEDEVEAAEEIEAFDDDELGDEFEDLEGDDFEDDDFEDGDDVEISDDLEELSRAAGAAFGGADGGDAG
jgi:segregation and condensation protein B